MSKYNLTVKGGGNTDNGPKRLLDGSEKSAFRLASQRNVIYTSQSGSKKVVKVSCNVCDHQMISHAVRMREHVLQKCRSKAKFDAVVLKEIRQDQFNKARKNSKEDQ